MIRYLSFYCFESEKIIPYLTHFDYALDAHQTTPTNLPVRAFFVIRFWSKKDTIIVPSHVRPVRQLRFPAF